MSAILETIVTHFVLHFGERMPKFLLRRWYPPSRLMNLVRVTAPPAQTCIWVNFNLNEVHMQIDVSMEVFRAEVTFIKGQLVCNSTIVAPFESAEKLETGPGKVAPKRIQLALTPDQKARLSREGICRIDGIVTLKTGFCEVQKQFSVQSVPVCFPALVTDPNR